MKTTRNTLLHCLLLCAFSFSATAGGTEPGWYLGLNGNVASNSMVFKSVSFDNISAKYDRLQRSGIGLGNYELDGSATQWGAGLELTYIFKNGFLGVSTGIGLTGLNYNMSLSGLDYSFRETDGGGNPYNKVVRVNKVNGNYINEKISTTFVDIPLMLRILVPAKKQSRAQFCIDAGVAARFAISQSSTAKVNADYEAVYYSDINGNTVEPFPSNTANTPYTVTRSHYTAYYNGDMTKVNNTFNNLYTSGIDVGLNQQFEKEGSYSIQSTVAVIIRPTITYSLTSSLLLSFGPSIAVVTYSPDNAGFNGYLKSRKNDKDNFKSLLSGVNSINVSSIGLNVGLTFKLPTMGAKVN